LEIEDANVRHKGDLNWYSSAVDAAKLGTSPDDAIKKYCDGEITGAEYTTPRIELLVSEAKVIRKLASKE
jgi:hypothetical protein